VGEGVRDDRMAVRRVLTGATLSLACLSIKADVPAAQVRAIVQELKQKGVVTEATGPCQLCGGTTLVYTATACLVASQQSALRVRVPPL
jgi:hypothetical protein